MPAKNMVNSQVNFFPWLFPDFTKKSFPLSQEEFSVKVGEILNFSQRRI